MERIFVNVMKVPTFGYMTDQNSPMYAKVAGLKTKETQ